MTPRIIDGLRTGEPGALGELFDAVGEELFQYCWLMVRGREAALAVVRNTIIVAHVHIDQLRDPNQLRTWLYALARAECQRYASAAPEEAVPDGDEARLMAWSAVMRLPSAEREMLDLTARRGMSASDAGLVTGLGVGAASLIEQARASLQQTMTAEIAARRPGVAPGKVSPAKVYARLPWPVLPPGMRADILACFTDERQAGHLTPAASRGGGLPLDAAVASTAPDGLPVVASTAPDGLPVTSTVPDGLPVVGVAAAGVDAGHRSDASLPELFSRTRPVPGSSVRVTASRRIAVGLLAAAIAVGAALVLAMAGLSLPGSTWSAPPVGSAVVAADGNVAHAGSGKKSTRPMVLFGSPTGRAQAAPGFRKGLGPWPGIRNAAALYLAILQPQSSQGPTTGSPDGQPSGSQPGLVPSATSVLPLSPVGSPSPLRPGSPSPPGSANPSPSVIPSA